MMHRKIRNLKNSLLTKRLEIGENKRFILFSPGLFLVLLGLAVLIAPKFFLALIAAFFISAGLFFSFIAWKFMQLKKKFDKLSQDFQGKVVLHGLQVVETAENNKFSDNSKKIVYH